jgi:hypothetical protein
MTRSKLSEVTASLWLSCRHSLIVLVMLLVTATSLQAQLRDRGAAERDTGRIGILGVRREARDARLGRADAEGAPNARNAPAPNSQRGVVPASSATARSQLPARDRLAPAVDNDLMPRNVPSTNLKRSAPTLPQNEISYRGPGVLILLPEEYKSDLHFLVDEVEPLTLRPGEQYRLSTKDSFVVRFSRGVIGERSLGEAYYSITEGVYAFTMTSRGWELYRQRDGLLPQAAKDPLDASATANSQAYDRVQDRPTKESLQHTEELPKPKPKPEIESIVE